MKARASLALVGACLGALAGCRDPGAPEAPPVEDAPATPDRLAPGETLAEAETAFGLSLPPGMRLQRHYSDSAYFSGEVPFEALLEHVRARVHTDSVQLLTRGALIARARVAGVDSDRLLRIELSQAPRGTLLHVKDITPPPALNGPSEAAIWRQVGRNPDGTPIDQNTAY